MMIITKTKILFLVIFLLFIITLGFGVVRYISSSLLITTANQLMAQDQPETAILLYQQAQSTFPFRKDIAIPLKKAKILLQSQLKFEDATQSTADLPRQKIPMPTRISLFHIPSPTPIHLLTPTPSSPGLTGVQSGPTIIPLPKQLSVPILMYHHIRINPQPGNALWASLHVNPTQLDQQLQYLVSHGYHTITFDELFAGLEGTIILPEKPIILTFDDGWKSFYENAFPLFQKYHIKATEFVVTSYDTYPAYMTWGQIQELDASGLITIGAHTRDHPDLTKLSTKTVVNEVKGSKEDIETHLKKTIRWFAYPYGAYNNRVVKAVQDAGFVGAVTTNIGTIQTLDNRFLMPRIMVDGRWNLTNFAQMLP